MNIYFLRISHFIRVIHAALTIVIVGMFVSSASFAHDMPKSSVLLHYRQDHVLLELRLPIDRLEIATGMVLSKSSDTFEKQRDALGSYISRRIQARGEGGDLWKVEVESLQPPVSVNIDEVRALVRLIPSRKEESLTDLSLRYEVILREIATHVAVLSIQTDWDRGVLANQPELIGSLGFNEYDIHIRRGNSSRFAGFLGMLDLGVEHISDGVDHVLFLITLILSGALVAENGRWKNRGSAKGTVLGIMWSVSAFTIGHSISLALGATKILILPSEPVEIVIAASVLISAIHCLRPIYPRREAWVAGGFGLVHGLAFASSLSVFNLDPSHLISAVLGFNLGIEVVQIAVVLAVVPSLIILSKTPGLSFIRFAVSILAGSAAIGWLFERTIGWSSPFTIIVDKLPKHAFEIASCLFLLSIACRTLFQLRLASLNKRQRLK